MFCRCTTICCVIFLIPVCYSIIPEVLDWANSRVEGDREPYLYSEQWAESVGFHQVERLAGCHDDNTTLDSTRVICANDIDSCSHNQSNKNALVCLNKCCAMGYSFSQSLLKCVHSERPFDPRHIFRDESDKRVNVSQFVIRRTTWNCSAGKSTYLWSSKSQHRSSLSVVVDTGKLYIPQIWIRDAQFIENYCIDGFLSSDGSYQIKALVCGESEQYWFVAFMAASMPWLFLISATFMLLTLAAYCVLSTLRRTLHGFTLSCHLASMAAHFIGLAIIYSNIITLTPFTCLFFGAVVHFFNISSFTWITVMGFDTWRKLKCSQAGRNEGGKSRASFDMKKRICYSVYGWGLPLAVVAASRLWESYSFWYNNPHGNIHDTIAYYGQRTRLCWYSYDYVKEMVFVNGPLVILLVGNLFFFIPSAIQVYQSSKFAAKSAASSNSKLENQRLHAIFRLFVLMEFHSIPCVLRLLSITTGVKVAVYIHVMEILFNASSGFFLFVNFAWKPHIFPRLQSLILAKPISLNQYLGRKYSLNSTETYYTNSKDEEIYSTMSLPVKLTKCEASYGN